ncbi:MAG: Unknown protein [uncultured Sulfurovum sp.]|uniref:BON domain-containing protein n=1 Tax=uncultured Sulfurovum sp. TaxID=269237 RepID=A0A6S6U2E9_9BACT|nr:MAG: Unknown protein [uncultured Sulfurovum sp.]
MNKVLQILVGLLLILVLAYLSFSELSGKIKDDLLSKTKTKLADEGIVGINSELEGEGLGLTRTMILRGEVNFEKDKAKVVSLVEGLEGIADVNNQLTVAIPVDTAPKVPVVQATIPVVKEVMKPTAPIKADEMKSSETKKNLTKEVVIEKVANKKVEKQEVQESVSSSESTTGMAKVSIPEVSSMPEVLSSKMDVKLPVIPVVPSATQKVSEVTEVTRPINVITVPVAVEAEKAIVSEKQNIEIQGVK